MAEVRARRLPEVDKVESEVTIRLKKEINYWDHRAQDLKAQERAGKQTRLSSVNAEARANDLADRLQRRLSNLARERDISALPPIIRGGAMSFRAASSPWKSAGARQLVLFPRIPSKWKSWRWLP